MKTFEYPDGSGYVEAEISDSEIVFKINSYESLWRLNQSVDAIYAVNKKKPNITIPCLIDAQADRRFAPNQSSGLRLVCKFLNEMNANFKIFHPHNPEVVEALINGVGIVSNASFILQVINSLILNLSHDKCGLILMSSDAGGFKPLMKTCQDINWKGETYSAAKSRNSDGDITQFIDRQDFGGKDILIVDDICVYGGTFKGLSKMLRERNCGRLYLAVSHMTVQNLGSDPVTNYYDRVFTTNSKYNEYYWGDSPINLSKKNLEIIKLF